MYSVNPTDVIQEVAHKLKLNAQETAIFMKEIDAGLATEWLAAIENLNDGNLLVRFKVACNIIDEPDETDGEYDDYPTEERYYVYDNNDDCVSDEFKYEEQAIKWATKHKYPIVKIHRYYRDPTRGYKLYPDSFPETIWENGQRVVSEN